MLGAAVLFPVEIGAGAAGAIHCALGTRVVEVANGQLAPWTGWLAML